MRAIALSGLKQKLASSIQNLIKMSEQKGFGSGFMIGSIVGGVVGGLLGTILATRNERQTSERDGEILPNRRDISFNSEESIELARHGLEDKIAQLNLAIDDVKQQLGSVNPNSEDS